MCTSLFLHIWQVSTANWCYHVLQSLSKFSADFSQHWSSWFRTKSWWPQRINFRQAQQWGSFCFSVEFQVCNIYENSEHQVESWKKNNDKANISPAKCNFYSDMMCVTSAMTWSILNIFQYTIVLLFDTWFYTHKQPKITKYSYYNCKDSLSPTSILFQLNIQLAARTWS